MDFFLHTFPQYIFSNVSLSIIISSSLSYTEKRRYRYLLFQSTTDNRKILTACRRYGFYPIHPIALLQLMQFSQFPFHASRRCPFSMSRIPKLFPVHLHSPFYMASWFHASISCISKYFFILPQFLW